MYFPIRSRLQKEMFKGIYAGEIIYALQDYEWEGVYCLATLKNARKKNNFIVCYVKQHWIVFYFPPSHPNCVEIFDSCPQKISLYPDSIQMFVKDYSGVVQPSYSLQSKNTYVCGFFCLLYIYYKHLHWPMEKIEYVLQTENIINSVLNKFNFPCCLVNHCITNDMCKKNKCCNNVMCE